MTKINSNFKILAILAVTLALCFTAVPAQAQTALSTTTLGAAITDRNSTTITLASTSTMLNMGLQNQVNTCFVVDKELFGVVTVVDSTHVTVQKRGGGCGALGAAARPTTHANGAKVYFAITGTNGNASTLIGSNDDQQAELYGSCTASALLRLPLFYLKTGDAFTCLRTGAAGTSGQWIKIGEGTMAPAGQTIRAFCTGQVGTGETDYLAGRACSGATGTGPGYLVTSPGTLANVYVYSSGVAVASSTDVFTVVLNGSNTALTCTIAVGAAVCNDLVHSVAVVPGDRVQFKQVAYTSDTLADLSVVVGIY